MIYKILFIDMDSKYFLVIVIILNNVYITLGKMRFAPQGEAEVVQDKLTIIYVNDEYMDASVNISNPGIKEATSNAFLTLKKTPPANLVLKIYPVREENGRFNIKGTTPVRHNICQYIKQDKILYPGFVKYGNLPRSCPIKPGDYYVNNYKVPVQNLPPMVPPGRYKIIFEISNSETRILNIEWEGTVSKK